MSEALNSLAASAQVEDVVDFFRALGWSISEHRNQRVFVLRRSDDTFPRVEFVIPREHAAADFTKRLIESASVLGELLNQSPETVLHRILEVRADVVRARVSSAVVDRNSLPLDTALRIVESLKDLVAYSATGETTPLPFFTRPSPRGVRHANRCRFGHTFEGSFGFTIESPLAPMVQEALLAESAPPPFERRVVERVYRGLVRVEQAVEERSLEPLLRGYEVGLNANMCDALLAMRERVPDLSVEYGVDWSPKVPESLILSQPPRVRIGPEADEYVQGAAKELRAAEPPRDLTIEGRVVLLKSDSAPWEDEADDPHTIVIAWLDANGKPVKTRLVLHPTEYLLACDAHKGGKTVSVRGTLERRGRYTRLANPTDFRWGSQLSLLDDLDSEAHD